MSLVLQLAVIFLASFVLTLAGLGGGLLFLPFFILLKFPVAIAVSALFYFRRHCCYFSSH